MSTATLTEPNRLICSVAELNELHRAECRDFFEEHGQNCIPTRMPEWWAMNNRQMAEWQARIDAGAREIARAGREQAKLDKAAAKAAEPVKAPKPGEVPTKIPGAVRATERVCETCGNVLPPVTSGRPPKYCDDCKSKMNTKSPAAPKAEPQECIEPGCPRTIKPVRNGLTPVRCPMHEVSFRIAQERGSAAPVEIPDFGFESPYES
jgi:hypothetical protein